MHNAIRQTAEVGIVAAPATVTAGLLPSIGDYPLFIIAEHMVTPDFLLRCLAAVVTLGAVWLAFHKQFSSRR